MGLSPFGNCSIFPEKKTKIVFAPNPNPINFKILHTEEINGNLIAKIVYPECTNFEGMKICLFKNMRAKDLNCMDSIDPHFAENKTSPFARFKPNQEGWELARILARRV